MWAQGHDAICTKQVRRNVAFVVGLVWKHAPAAGSLLAMLAPSWRVPLRPLVVWSVTGLIDALTEAVAAEQAELWPADRALAAGVARRVWRYAASRSAGRRLLWTQRVACAGHGSGAACGTREGRRATPECL